MKQYLIRHKAPAPDSINGWKNASFPLGNGYMGISLFGGAARERLQLTDPTLVTGGCSKWIDNRYFSGQESFGDLYLSQSGIGEIEDYERTLSLNDATATVRFSSGGVTYTRTAFASYPDRVGVLHITASKAGALTLTMHPTLANLRDALPVDPPAKFSGKWGEVHAEGDTVVAKGFSEYYGIQFEGIFTLLHEGGTLRAEKDALTLTGADCATVLFTLGTNYRLEEKTFLLGREEKLSGNPLPHEELMLRMQKARELCYEELLSRHIADHSQYFSRVSLDLGKEDDGRTTPELIASCRAENEESYLEELYFQMGRYMSIATSREGTLPPGLQGKWNAYVIPPWTAGYWYNVNQQMNYWGIFSTNLAELYEPYLNFNLARMKQAEKNGDAYIRALRPDQYEDGEGKNGWIVGTGNSAYTVAGAANIGHSGPGTGGFTAVSDMDYYRFTRSPEVLARVYPILESLGRFYKKCLKPFGDEYLVEPSASPEIVHEGKHYHTRGCAFDQQMVYETLRSLIDMYDAERENLPNADAALIEELRAVVDHLSPVLIGGSGQVKEFREENLYGEIGEKHHRHISQLVGLYPGTVINENTPKWLDAAKKTLHFRGNLAGCGWSLAHKLGMWARVGDGNISHDIVLALIRTHLYDNLWNSHDVLSNESFERSVFQADGNFGATAGIAEMLLSSSGKYICPLFALPDAWQTGSFSGLVARGNFVFEVSWENRVARTLRIISRAGGAMLLKYPSLSRYRITKNGIPMPSASGDTVALESERGDLFEFTL